MSREQPGCGTPYVRSRAIPSCPAAGTALLATAGATTPLALIVAGSILIGLISLAMPAMTAAVLGVAVLGSLLGQGHALSLRVPLLVATAGYLVAIALVCVTLRDR